MNRAYVFEILALTVLLVISELIYFRIAKAYRIIDKPNERSSHVKPVIRGGGVIFLITILVWSIWHVFVEHEFPWPWFIVGITAAAFISFVDDIKPQPARVRFVIHFFAIVTIFYSTEVFLFWPWWLCGFALIVCIGALNAFNFMDGINGITGIYSLVMLGTFLFVNCYVIGFSDTEFVVANIIGIVVFLYFNFRRKAACFAGDVGSVTMAFVLIFLLMQLIYASQNLLWVMLFLVYGIDAVVTIVYRLGRKENIFKPHRTHLYQYLCNELKWQHRTVSLLYGVVQLATNAVLVYCIQHDNTVLAVGLGIALLIYYLVQRRMILAAIGRGAAPSH